MIRLRFLQLCIAPRGVLAFVAISPLAAAQQLLFELAGDNTALNKPFDLVGATCVGLGDVDGDGVADLLVGASRYNTSATRLEGAAFVFSGATHVLLRKHLGASRDGQSSRGLDGGLDVDGDGVSDYVLGETYGDFTKFDGGTVHVYSGATGAEIWTFGGEHAVDLLGESVALLHDVDGDGCAEILATAYLWDNVPLGLVQCGRAYCWSGRTGTLLWTFDGILNDQALIYCSELGDINGDGLHDVALGSGGAGAAGNGAGSVDIVDGANGSLLMSIVGSAANDAFCRVGGAGDIDFDGVDDLLVGAAAANNGDGRVTVHSGASGAELFRHDGAKGDYLSVVATRANRDWNRDGHFDYMIGNPTRTPDDCSGGVVRLHSGRTGRLLFEYRSRDDLGLGADFGVSISMVADLSGDAIPEIMVGATAAGPTGANDGRVYVFAGDDLFLQANQSDYDNGDPIAIELRGGAPGVLGMVALTELDGAPLFVPLVVAPLDTNGELAFADVTDPSYVGHSVELRGWCQRPTGRGLVDSNVEWFKF